MCTQSGARTEMYSTTVRLYSVLSTQYSVNGHVSLYYVVCSRPGKLQQSQVDAKFSTQCEFVHLPGVLFSLELRLAQPLSTTLTRARFSPCRITFSRRIVASGARMAQRAGAGTCRVPLRGGLGAAAPRTIHDTPPRHMYRAARPHTETMLLLIFSQIFPHFDGII
jgi:hypothetical protein